MHGGGAEQCCAQVQIYFHAEKLKNTDTLSKSDPFAVLSTLTHKSPLGARDNEYQRVGRTETVRDNLNPEWKTSVPMNYYFEQKQELLIEIYDDDSKDRIDVNNEKILRCEFTMAQMMSARGHVLALKDGKSTVFVTGVITGVHADDTVEVKLSARNVKDMDTMGKSDPYFILSRLLPGGRKNQLHRSEVIDNNSNPDWKPCPTFPMSQLTGANPDEVTLEIQLYDKDRFSDDFIGVAQFSYNQLVQSPGGRGDFQGIFVRPKANDSRGENCGRIVADCKLNSKMTFAQHLSAGLQINLAASVDFTASNGNPNQPKSLHYMDPHQPNPYVQCIMEVGNILMQYDIDKQVPAFGFGAELPAEKPKELFVVNVPEISHFFHLNFQANPYVYGVQGVLDAYGQCLSQVNLAGPTNFCPSITQVCNGARAATGVYTVHLILTDGEITDMEETIDAIVAASDAPLSIVIIGIGSGCDFKAMDQLDGDGDKLKNAQGVSAGRDLVQFVTFNKFKGNAQALAAEVLREIPKQVEAWYNLPQRHR